MSARDVNTPALSSSSVRVLVAAPPFSSRTLPLLKRVLHETSTTLLPLGSVPKSLGLGSFTRIWNRRESLPTKFFVSASSFRMGSVSWATSAPPLVSIVWFIFSAA